MNHTNYINILQAALGRKGQLERLKRGYKGVCVCVGGGVSRSDHGKGLTLEPKGLLERLKNEYKGACVCMACVCAWCVYVLGIRLGLHTYMCVYESRESVCECLGTPVRMDFFFLSQGYKRKKCCIFHYYTYMHVSICLERGGVAFLVLTH